MSDMNTNDERFVTLIRSGLIWHGGPKSQEQAIWYLIAHPDAMNDRVPEPIRTALADGWRPAGEPPEHPSVGYICFLPAAPMPGGDR
jgi:hypothetical protein